MESNEVLICADCGCVIEDECDSYELKDGRIVCCECIDDYSRCDDCDEYVHDNEITRVDGRWVCNECLEDDSEYFYCDCCEEYHRTAYRWGNANDGRNICCDCRDEYYDECYDCGTTLPTNDMTYDSDNGEYYCADCMRNNRSKAIHDYGYKPAPKFKAGTHDEFSTSESIRELLFGIELEVDNGEYAADTAEEICAMSDDVYCKHDGSLNTGFEIVTHPCTLEYHTASFGWDKVCQIAVDNGFKSHDTSTCGLHIHVGRWQLGNDSGERDRTASKIILLVDRHWDNIVKFTRREVRKLDEWARRPDISLRNYMDEKLAIAVALATMRNGRYQAVNLTNNSTVEFRMFRGTLEPRTILASLQLTSNICLYAKNHDVTEVLASQWDDITGYETYDELTDYLSSRGITGEYIAPFELNILPEAARDRADRSFEIGDRVVIKNNNGYGVGTLCRFIGQAATIVRNGVNGYDFGIVFDIANSALHDLDGSVPNFTGYWVHASNLALA